MLPKIKNSRKIFMEITYNTKRCNYHFKCDKIIDKSEYLIAIKGMYMALSNNPNWCRFIKDVIKFQEKKEEIYFKKQLKLHLKQIKN